MGRRGVVGQRQCAASSACVHARRTIRRLLVAGAFCLIGWVALAVFGADAASASEHSPGGRELGGVVTTVLGSGSADSAATTEQAGPRGRATGDRSQAPARPPPAAAEGGLGSVVGSTLEATTATVGEGHPAPEVAAPVTGTVGTMPEPLPPAVEALAESEAAADWNEAAADWQPPRFDGFDELDLIPGGDLVSGHEVGGASPAPATPRPACTHDDHGRSDASGAVPPLVADVTPDGGDATTTTYEAPGAAGVGAGELPADGPAAPGSSQWPTGASSTSTSSTNNGGSGNGTPLACGGPVGVSAQHTVLGIARAFDDLAPLGDAVKPDVSPD